MVIESSAATIDMINVNGLGDQKSITIEVSGSGNYEFSIDGFTFQDSNVFENIAPGILTIYVNDTNGCGEVEETIEIEEDLSPGGFPNFFTPNADGINDFWQFIPPENGQVNVKTILIFDRFGKLITQIDPTGNGWDGAMNGRRLPSSDYWFKAISFDDDRFTGHFTLKR